MQGVVKMELSDREVRILEVLSLCPLKASKLMDQIGFSKTTTYRLLNKLEKKNLVAKENGFYRITLLGRRILEGLKGEIRVHACKVVLDALDVNMFIIKERGREVEMKNWECYFIDLDKYGIDAKAQVNIEKTTVVLHLPEFRAKNLVHALLIIQNLTAKCRRALEIEGPVTEEAWRDISFKIKYTEYAFKLPPEDPSTHHEVQFDYNAVSNCCQTLFLSYSSCQKIKA